MKFLILDQVVLSNYNFKSVDKLVIAYIMNLQKGGKKFYGSVNYLSKELGITVDLISESLNFLTINNVLSHSQAGIGIAVPFYQLAFFITDQDKSLKELSKALADKFKEKMNNG